MHCGVYKACMEYNMMRVVWKLNLPSWWLIFLIFRHKNTTHRSMEVTLKTSQKWCRNLFDYNPLQSSPAGSIFFYSQNYDVSSQIHFLISGAVWVEHLLRYSWSTSVWARVTFLSLFSRQSPWRQRRGERMLLTAPPGQREKGGGWKRENDWSWWANRRRGSKKSNI